MGMGGWVRCKAEYYFWELEWKRDVEGRTRWTKMGVMSVVAVALPDETTHEGSDALVEECHLSLCRCTVPRLLRCQRYSG